MKRQLIKINDFEVGKTYRHFKNKRMVVTVRRRFETSKGLNLVLEHPWVSEWQICLARVYENSKWEVVL